MEYGPKPTDPPSAPSPPPTPAPVPVPVPLPPTTPAPVPVSKAPANVARQNSSSSDSGGSFMRDSQRHKQLPMDRKFPGVGGGGRSAQKLHSAFRKVKALLGKILFIIGFTGTKH